MPCARLSCSRRLSPLTVEGPAHPGLRRCLRRRTPMKVTFTEAPPPDPEALEAGRRLFAGPVEFLKGVVAMDGLPPADRAEVCFAGRSNVGKSSLINALTGRKALARASNTPGRTQEINFFTLGRAPLSRRPARLRLRRGAEAGRRALAGAAPRLPRRPPDAAPGLPARSTPATAPKPVDAEIMALLDRSAVTFQAVLTKADKPSAAAPRRRRPPHCRRPRPASGSLPGDRRHLGREGHRPRHPARHRRRRL